MTDTPYGYCPKCGAPGRTRERRPNGNDLCENGHLYPSRQARSHLPSMTAISDKAVQEALDWFEPDEFDDPARINGDRKHLSVLKARIEADAKEIDRLRMESNRLHEAAMIARNEAMTERGKCNAARAEIARAKRECIG